MLWKTIKNKDFSTTYDLAKFAILRGYAAFDEIGVVIAKRFKIRQEMVKELKFRKVYKNIVILLG